MYITSIIPIGRVISKETLTYLSKEKLEEGSVVSVPLRSKQAFGIVVSSEKAEQMKAEIKDMDFKIKKLESQIEAGINKHLVAASKKFAEYTCTTTGSVLGCLINEEIIDCLKNFPKINSKIEKKFEEYAIQSPIEDRINILKSIIRESFAKKQSVTILVPTQFLAEKYLELLSKGIEQYSVVLHSGLSKKKLFDAAKRLSDPHPMSVVSTGEFLSLTREDTGVIVAEEEHSRFYKMQRRPFLDWREFGRFLAKETNTKIIYSDALLRVETIERIKSGEIQEYGRIVQKIAHQIKILQVDMKEKEEEAKKFSALSDELKEMVKFATVHKKKLFIFAFRHGLSSETVCRDCGTTVLCERCFAPIATHKGKSENIFLCHHCGSKRSAKETCKNCGGWRLESFGIGTERIVEELKEIGVEVIEGYKSELKKSDNKKSVEEFIKKGGVVVGSESFLDKLPEKSADYIAIASIDSLFALPDFRIRERIMHLLIDIKSKAAENLLIQGRNLDSSVVEQGLSGDLNSFYKEEIGLRKKFGYPPFLIFIKFTVLGEKIKVKSEMEKLANYLKDYNPDIFPAFIRVRAGKTVSHMLIKITKADWPDKELRKKILNLPPNIEVRFDPESLL